MELILFFNNCTVIAYSTVLKEFQHVEDYKDQGEIVRRKVNQLISLLTNDGLLNTERTKALKLKERFCQNSSTVSNKKKKVGMFSKVEAVFFLF